MTEWPSMLNRRIFEDAQFYLLAERGTRWSNTPIKKTKEIQLG